MVATSDSSQKSDTQVLERDQRSGHNSSISSKAKFSLAQFRLLISISIVALFVTSLYLLIGLPYYETNDDLTMTHILTGTCFLSKPDEHIIFTHIFVGLLLKHIYALMPDIAWYGIFQTAGMFVSMTAITWLVIGKSRRPRMMFVLGFAALLVTCVRPLLVMQFTYTGTLLAAAGILLMMESVERFYLRKRAIVCAILAVTMFALASLVRGSSAELVAILSALFVVSRFLPVIKRQWRNMLFQLVGIGVAYAIVFSLTVINDYYSYQGRWSNFYPLIKATNAIREYRCDDVTSPLSQTIYKQVGWDSPDVMVFFTCWYNLDQKTYSLEKVQTVAKLLNDNWMKNFEIREFFSAIKELVTNQHFVPVVLPALFLIPFINRAKLPILSIAFLSAGILALCTASILFMKLPFRGLASIMMLCTLFGIRYISISKIRKALQRDPSSDGKRGTTYATILLAAVIAPSFLLLFQLKAHALMLAKEESQFLRAIENLSPKPNQVYIRWAWAFPASCIGPFADLNKFSPSNFKMLGIGAIGQAPYVVDRMKEFDIDDVFARLDREDVFILSNDEINKFIAAFVAQRYEKETVFIPIPIEPPAFQVFKVKHSKPANYAKFRRKWHLDELANQK